MPEPALRAAAAAGVLTLALMTGGLAAGPAVAQPADSDGTSQDSADSTDSAGSQDDAASSSESSGTSSGNTDDDDAEDGDELTATDSEPQEETLAGAVATESGLDDPGGDRRATDTELVPASEIPKKLEFSNSLRIPVPRLPAAGEIPAGSWPTLSSFYTTVDIPVPTFEEFLTALAINPSPEPPPGPAFRTQEEEPVADATSGTVGGAGGGGMMSESPVMRAPLVSVPRLNTLGGQGTRPLDVPASAAGPGPGVTQPGVAGARAPLIRGSLPPSPQASAQSAPAARGGPPPARTGYPRALRNPTLAELAVVALPGVAGLVFLTFSGGVIGYRQANSSRFVRTAGAERFLR